MAACARDRGCAAADAGQQDQSPAPMGDAIRRPALQSPRRMSSRFCGQDRRGFFVEKHREGKSFGDIAATAFVARTPPSSPSIGMNGTTSTAPMRGARPGGAQIDIGERARRGPEFRRQATWHRRKREHGAVMSGVGLHVETRSLGRAPSATVIRSMTSSRRPSLHSEHIR